MDRAPRLDVVELERLVVRELLARVDQADLVDLDPFLFLELPLDLQDLVGGLEGHGLLAARQRLDEDLRVIFQLIGREVGRARRARVCVPRVTLSLSARVLTRLRGVRSSHGYAAAVVFIIQLLPRRAALRFGAPDSHLDAAGGPACRRKAASASLVSQ